jgi:hypothetical protein
MGSLLTLGCRWPSRPAPDVYSGPMLPPAPTLEQIFQQVNSNSRQIQSFAASRATLTGQGFPTLRASVYFERQRRFRLRAETAFTGTEFDLGSNEDAFWIWVRRNDPPALLYCRHDQYAQSAARRTLALDPEWLIEALGIVEFDPAQPHQGPTPQPNGRIEIRSVRQTPLGPTTKVTILDARQGRVLEQHLFDAQGQRLASAVSSQHRRDPLTALELPRVTDVSLPPSNLNFRLDLGNTEINRLSGDTSLLWKMPSYEGYPAVDLCDPRLQAPATAGTGYATAPR